MAKKKTDEPKVYKEHPSVDQRITDTLRENYMPYAMSVIVSRAIPEIDGFKPSHRKLLYTMYKMGLLNGNRTKSANIVGQTMKLNPHGDAAIYETMVRLTRGNEALLHAVCGQQGQLRQGVLARYGIRRVRVIPRPSWMRSVPSCSAISTPTQWILWTTMTAR